MWALKNSFLVSMSTMYLNFDRRKTRLETVLHTLLVCESQRSCFCCCLWLYLKDGEREREREREGGRENSNSKTSFYKDQLVLAMLLMTKYKITVTVYIHTGMNEWMEFYTWEFPHTKYRVHSARCTHTYISLLHIISIQPANKAVNIWSVHMTGIGKENSSQYLTNKEQLWRGGGRKGGGGWKSLSQAWKDWAEFYGCIK